MLLKKVYEDSLRLVKPYNFHLSSSFYAFPYEYDGLNSYIVFSFDEGYSVAKMRLVGEGEVLIEIYTNSASSILVEKTVA